MQLPRLYKGPGDQALRLLKDGVLAEAGGCHKVEEGGAESGPATAAEMLACLADLLTVSPFPEL